MSSSQTKLLLSEEKNQTSFFFPLQKYSIIFLLEITDGSQQNVACATKNVFKVK
jgi:hypothetical protein